MSDKLTLTGYVSVKEFGGYALPVPIQNKLLKTYCNDNNFIYRLPMNETCLHENFMFLFSTINMASNNSNIGMCSIHMFPKNKSKFKLLLNKVIEKGFDGQHFIDGFSSHLRDLIVSQNTKTHVLLEQKQYTFRKIRKTS